MNERTLKRSLFLAVGVCILLASALAYTALHRDGRAFAQNQAEPVVASGPAITAAAKENAAPSDKEPVMSTVQLSPERMQQIGVTVATVQTKDVSADLEVPGSVAMDEQRLSYVQTRFPGWIRSVYANATYQYVKKGQQLFTIYSPDLVSTEQEYLLAKQNQKTFSDHMHGTAADESNWLTQAAQERLRRFDISSAEIARIDQAGTVQREIPVESPVSGFIVERNALPNAYVQPDTKLYTIADLSTVWVYANVFQTDVGRLRPGNPAHVMVDAYPGRVFSGRIDQILPEVDASTRTVKVRLVFSNPGVVLKPGMFVSVKISAPLGRQLLIPASGVLQAGERQIAFVDRGQGIFERTEIETGPRVDDSVVVLKGLKSGDRVVSSANFLVDSEAQLQSAMEGSAPSQPQSAKTQQQAPEQVRIDLSTQPSPPRRGANTLRVKLTGADGKPLSAAQVNVTFFMPAMPAMGMAALRITSDLADKGTGTYEGVLQLSSGGTWDVTVKVSRNQQVIATKKMSVNAAGGM